MVLGCFQNTWHIWRWFCCPVPLASKTRKLCGQWRLLSSKNTARTCMSSAAFSCPTLPKRDQADETKHYVTTKDTYSGPMRETRARLPFKDENYTGAIFMQSWGSTLYLQSGMHVKAVFWRIWLLFPYPTILLPSPKIGLLMGLCLLFPKLPCGSPMGISAGFYVTLSFQKHEEVVGVGFSLTCSDPNKLIEEVAYEQTLQKRKT
jgi:hypothetical protein